MPGINNKRVAELAKEYGFDLTGFAKAEPLVEEIENLNIWIEKKYHATMEYIPRNVEKRRDVSLILPGAKSIISLAMNYYNPASYENLPGWGKISRYAWGKDYHLIMWEKIESLIEDLKEIDPGFNAVGYVDTGPVMDKVWAVRSGLGWQGKNSNVISREYGSWFFIATIITNYEFDYSPRVEDYCGSCRACIEACPTSAIVADGVIDSGRCISFLTIENKGEIGIGFKGKMDNWLFGCDVCQDVCPWNIKFAIPSRVEEFMNPEVKEINFDSIEAMDELEFKTRFDSSPIYRAKLKGLKRNARFLKENSASLDN